jgi:hypothetical protein
MLQECDLIDEWIFAAATSGLDPFVRVAITFEAHAEAIANAAWPSGDVGLPRSQFVS